MNYSLISIKCIFPALKKHLSIETKAQVKDNINFVAYVISRF